MAFESSASLMVTSGPPQRATRCVFLSPSLAHFGVIDSTRRVAKPPATNKAYRRAQRRIRVRKVTAADGSHKGLGRVASS
jgi:hypothetical protein